MRSSAACEDGDSTSFAGRFETTIVSEPHELNGAVQHVRQVAARFGVAPEDLSVVVQAYIAAEAAGVVLSTDPMNEHAGPVVEYIRGAGAPLVSGLTTPWRHHRGDKQLADSPCRSTLLDQLCDAATSAAATLGGPVDMEWAVADDTVYWLQLRALTGLRRRRAFEVPVEQASRLQGRWVLMEHCTLPVVPLIVSLDPGGYFDGPAWRSEVVSGYHYIALEQKLPNGGVVD